MKLYRGQTLRIRLAGTDDDWCPATVEVASENGISVGLVLDEAVRTASGGLIAGALPLHIEDGKIRSLFGDEYEIEGAKS